MLLNKPAYFNDILDSLFLQIGISASNSSRIKTLRNQAEKYYLNIFTWRSQRNLVFSLVLKVLGYSHKEWYMADTRPTISPCWLPKQKLVSCHRPPLQDKWDFGGPSVEPGHSVVIVRITASRSRGPSADWVFYHNLSS